MSIFNELCHCEILRELFQELTNDVILLTFDGMSIYGKVQRIDEHRLIVLTPASGQQAVFTLTAGGSVLKDAYAIVDGCSIVGKVTGINCFPFGSEISA